MAKSATSVILEKTGPDFQDPPFAISAQKSLGFSGPTFSNGPCNGFAPIKEGGERDYEVYLLRTATYPPPLPPPALQREFEQYNIEINSKM